MALFLARFIVLSSGSMPKNANIVAYILMNTYADRLLRGTIYNISQRHQKAEFDRSFDYKRGTHHHLP